MSKFLPKPLTTFKAAALLAASLAALVALAPARPQAGGRSTGVAAPVARTAPAAPCGEPVRLSGLIHLIVRTAPGAGGATHTVEGFDLRAVRGAGETSGAAYRFEAVADGRRNLPCGPAEHCAAKALSAFKTSGDGPDDQLRGHLIVAIRARPGGEPAAELVEFKFICPQ